MNFLNKEPTAEDNLRQLFEDGIRKIDKKILFIERYPDNDTEQYRGRYKRDGLQCMWEGFKMHAEMVPPTKILDTVKFSPDGLTIAELKEVIKDWPEVDNKGEPCQVWVGDGNSHGISNPAHSIGSLNIGHVTGHRWADILIDA